MLNPLLLAAAACALLLFGLFQSSAAQAPSAQPAPPAQPAQPAQPAAVRLDAVVTEEGGRFVEGLRTEDLRLYVNGVEQRVSGVEPVSLPVTYGLVVDNSGSLRTQFGAVLITARSFVEENRPGDETFVVRFVHRDAVAILQGVTADRAALIEALGRMRVEGGQTALVDALHVSAEHLLKERPADAGRRRALVLLSDGEDRASLRKLEDLLRLLRGTGVRLFCVGFVADLDRGEGFIRKSKRDKATDLLKRLAAETGGLALFPETVPELRAAFGELVRHIRTQYVVTFVPAPGFRPQDIRKIELKVSGGKKRRAAVSLAGPEAAPKD